MNNNFINNEHKIDKNNIVMELKVYVNCFLFRFVNSIGFIFRDKMFMTELLIKALEFFA